MAWPHLFFIHNRIPEIRDITPLMSVPHNQLSNKLGSLDLHQPLYYRTACCCSGLLQVCNLRLLWHVPGYRHSVLPTVTNSVTDGHIIKTSSIRLPIVKHMAHTDLNLHTLKFSYKLCRLKMKRKIKFLSGLCHVDNNVLRFLFNVMDRNVLAELKHRYDS